MTLQEYMEEVKKCFMDGTELSKEEIEDFFNSRKAKETIKEDYEDFNDPEARELTGVSPQSTATCLDYLL